MKTRNKLFVFLLSLTAFLFLLGIATWLLARSPQEGAGNIASPPGGDAARERTLAEATQARFLSIFVSTPSGGLFSYMVGGSTDEFKAFAEAIAQAQPLDGASDETFSDLLVLSFGPNDTLEVSYSRTRNQFIIGDKLYQPAADLGPMIAAVEQRFNG